MRILSLQTHTPPAGQAGEYFAELNIFKSGGDWPEKYLPKAGSEPKFLKNYPLPIKWPR